MRDILQIAEQNLFFGAVVAAAGMLLLLAGYYVVYRGILKGKRKLDKRTIVLGVLLVCYIMIVAGATLGSRAKCYQGSLNMHLFSSYKEAWNKCSITDWRNLILNILMFFPLGFLLPCVIKKCRIWWLTYLAGFLFSICIEVIQLLTGLGIFELDDIFNNTVGTMIGYGILVLFLFIFKKRINGKQIIKGKKRMTVLLLQCPLLSMLIVFVILGIVYQNQELGNLSIAYNYRQNMSKIQIASDAVFSDKSKMMEVYQAVVGNKEDTLKTARNFFSILGTDVDETQEDVYADCIYYKSENGKYSILVNDTGLTTWYTDFSLVDSEGQSGLSFEEVRTVLKKYQIEIPEQAEFKELGGGQYQISAYMTDMGEYYLNGTLTCTVTDWKLSGMHNDMFRCSPYKKYKIISEKKAYERITEGKFLAYISSTDKDTKYVVKKEILGYQLDSKGYAQPVYEFYFDGYDGTISIPALDK